VNTNFTGGGKRNKVQGGGRGKKKNDVPCKKGFPRCGKKKNFTNTGEKKKKKEKKNLSFPRRRDIKRERGGYRSDLFRGKGGKKRSKTKKKRGEGVGGQLMSA